MAKYSQGIYQLKNPQKYSGNKAPRYRSSWEWAFFAFADNNPSVINWASEAIFVPYVDPLTGRNTIYVPDILIVYVDKNGKKHAEVIEIKPSNQTTLEAARTMQDKAAAIKNQAKWQAADIWCRSKGLTFRVVTEKQLFHQGSKKRR